MKYWIALAFALLGSVAFGAPSEKNLAAIESSYDPAIQVNEVSKGFSLKGCYLNSLEITGKDPVTGRQRKVQAKHYFPIGISDLAQAPKAVIVMPPTGGENILDQAYANELCDAGIRAVLIQSWELDTFVELDMGMHDRGALRALSSVRHVVEYLKATKAERIGILGTSVGAISAAFALGMDARIEAAALIVGGAGMSEIIASSTEKGLTALRKQRFEAFGFKNEVEYGKALSKKVVIEPLDFIDFSGPKKTLQVIALQDTTVPTKNQYDLHQALGPAEVITHDANHLNTILYSSVFLKSRIVRFLDANL